MGNLHFCARCGASPAVNGEYCNPCWDFLNDRDKLLMLPLIKQATKPMADSGKRLTFGTGSQRDSQDGKPRPGLVSVHANMRTGVIHMLGSIKYEARNWEKGQPQSQFWESLMRHLMLHAMGDTSEDHAAQARWNLDGMLSQEERVLAGTLPVTLLDLPWYQPDPIAYLKRLPTRVFLDGDTQAAQEAAANYRQQVEAARNKEPL